MSAITSPFFDNKQFKQLDIMQGTINGEAPFKALHSSLCVAPTTSGYTLNYAVSKEGPWTAYSEATPANEALVINGATPYMWFKLAGNADENVEVIL